MPRQIRSQAAAEVLPHRDQPAQGGRANIVQKLKPADLTPLRAALAELWLRGGELRRMHRLHVLLLVSLGRSCYEVAAWFGENPRTIERWVQRYEAQGLEGLQDHHHGGRPSKLSAEQAPRLEQQLRQAPPLLGYGQARWSGKLLCRHLEEHYGLRFSLRQCQRLMRSMTSH